MKKVWVFRHGTRENGASVISPEVSLKSPAGVELTKRVAELFLKNQTFEKIFVSPFVRTYQTGMIFALCLEMSFPTVEPGLGPDNFKDWERLAKKVKGDSYLDFFDTDQKLMQHDAVRVFETIHRITRLLPPEKQTLCVGHGGFIEPALAVALWLPSRKKPTFREVLSQIVALKQGEAIIFIFDGDNHFVGYEEKRLSS